MYEEEMESKILGQLDIHLLSILYWCSPFHTVKHRYVSVRLEQDPHRDDDVAGPEPALVGGAVRVDLAQHQVQTVLVAANRRLSIFFTNS